MLISSRESCLRIRPGLDLCEDRVVRVGLDRDPVAAERDIVQFAVRVVAPDRYGERVVLYVMDRCARVGCGYVCCCKQGSGAVGIQLESIVRYS